MEHGEEQPRLDPGEVSYVDHFWVSTKLTGPEHKATSPFTRINTFSSGFF